MKKTFRFYVGTWAIALLLFNVFVFVVPKEVKGNFWGGYSFITAAFLGQLFCARIVFRSKNARKAFYNVPLIIIGTSGTLVMLVIGSVTMATSAFPLWLGSFLCLAVVAYSAIVLISAAAASDAVNCIDHKTEVQTAFIRTLTANTYVLLSKVRDEEVSKLVKRVYEAFRYSDPVSNDAVSELEAQITSCFKNFENAVCENTENASALAEELLVLIEERKCKLLKQEV